jgi:hypothetical protein
LMTMDDRDLFDGTIWPEDSVYMEALERVRGWSYRIMP